MDEWWLWFMNELWYCIMYYPCFTHARMNDDYDSWMNYDYDSGMSDDYDSWMNDDYDSWMNEV